MCRNCSSALITEKSGKRITAAGICCNCEASLTPTHGKRKDSPATIETRPVKVAKVIKTTADALATMKATFHLTVSETAICATMMKLGNKPMKKSRLAYTMIASNPKLSAWAMLRKELSDLTRKGVFTCVDSDNKPTSYNAYAPIRLPYGSE